MASWSRMEPSNVSPDSAGGKSSLIRFQHGLDEAQRLGFDPGCGHGGNADRAETVPPGGRRPAFPGSVLDLALHDDAVSGVVAKDECGGQPCSLREGEGHAGVGFFSLDVLS